MPLVADDAETNAKVIAALEEVVAGLRAGRYGVYSFSDADVRPAVLFDIEPTARHIVLELAVVPEHMRRS
jgi:hypothetical protein